MRQCPNCHHNELTGALFCSEFGASLVFQDAVSSSFPFGAPVEIHKPDAGVSPRVTLQVLNTGKVLPIEDEVEAFSCLDCH